MRFVAWHRRKQPWNTDVGKAAILCSVGVAAFAKRKLFLILNPVMAGIITAAVGFWYVKWLHSDAFPCALLDKSALESLKMSEDILSGEK
jgi:uncharacterized membrane protein